MQGQCGSQTVCIFQARRNFTFQGQISFKLVSNFKLILKSNRKGNSNPSSMKRLTEKIIHIKNYKNDICIGCIGYQNEPPNVSSNL